VNRQRKSWLLLKASYLWFDGCRFRATDVLWAGLRLFFPLVDVLIEVGASFRVRYDLKFCAFTRRHKPFADLLYA